MAYPGRALRVGNIKARLLWFDSLGAKSACVLVETPDLRLLLDPGAAAMQPSYPLPGELKERLRLRAYEAIQAAAKRADVVVITHYHHDHHVRFDFPIDARAIYGGKIIWAKDPNCYINKSQWDRARLLYDQMCRKLGGLAGLEELLEAPKRTSFKDPLKDLALAVKRDFGDYRARREELLAKGRAWLEKLAKDLWARRGWVPELELGGTHVEFVDGQEREIGKTIVRFVGPLFHGIEYARVGWVLAVVVERGGSKLIYSSDLQGPVIEDYAAWLVREDPGALILDGPPTYLFGYMLNRVNLSRAVENICFLVRETKADPIILDHHLLREARYAERLAEVYRLAKRTGKRVLTAAEWLGQEPLVLRAARGELPTL